MFGMSADTAKRCEPPIDRKPCPVWSGMRGAEARVGLRPPCGLAFGPAMRPSASLRATPLQFDAGGCRVSAIVGMNPEPPGGAVARMERSGMRGAVVGGMVRRGATVGLALVLDCGHGENAFGKRRPSTP